MTTPITEEFIGREHLTPPLRRFIGDLRLLTNEASVETASRVYASATAKALCDTWAKANGLRHSSGHACLGRLRDGRGWAWSKKDRIPCNLPGYAADHMSLWNKHGTALAKTSFTLVGNELDRVGEISA